MLALPHAAVHVFTSRAPCGYVPRPLASQSITAGGGHGFRVCEREEYAQGMYNNDSLKCEACRSVVSRSPAREVSRLESLGSALRLRALSALASRVSRLAPHAPSLSCAPVADSLFSSHARRARLRHSVRSDCACVTKSAGTAVSVAGMKNETN